MSSEPDSATYPTAAEELARRLEQDMTDRGLGPGDRYMTAAEAGRLLNVSGASAHRAMVVLAERQLLVRRSVGTFGGPKLKRRAVVGAPTVYILVPAKLLASFDPFLADDMVKGLRQGTSRTANVQLCALLETRELDQTKEIIASAKHTSGRFGIIARSCPPEVYQCLIDNHIPSVVVGTVYPGQEDLPSIDYDFLQGGRLLMRYLIRRGHTRIAALFLSGHLAGDGHMLEGLHDAMSEAGLAANALRVRSVPRDPTRIAAQVEHLLAQPDRPTAMVTVLEQMAMIAVNAASAKGLAVPDDFEVVFGVRDFRECGRQPVEHTCLRLALSPLQMFEQAGDMLGRLWDGVPLEQKRVIIPAVLCERDSIADRTGHPIGASSC